MMRPAALGLAYTLAAALLLPAPPLSADPPPEKTDTSTAPVPAPAPQPATQTTATAPQATPTQAAPPPQPPAPAAPAEARSAKAAKPHKPKSPKAHAAAPGSVTIKDFSYGPASVTVNAGDSVTWVNQGPTKHSATAKDGSFDTGLLAKGGSASHSFTKAGTFSYVCSIHPFMHGTVKVVAAAAQQTPSSGGSTSSSGTPSSSSASTSSPSGGAAASSKPSLPRTGGDAGPLALLGLLFVGLGVIGRRRSPAA